MKLTLTLALFCAHLVTFSQGPEKKLLFKLEEPMNGISSSGTNTVYSKAARGLNAESLTPRIELCDAKNGFTIRTDFHIRKYDDNFNLVWENDLKKNYSLQARPSSATFSDDKNTFFIELTYSNDASVSKIDEKGKISNVEVPRYKGFPFMLNHEVFFIGSEVDKKASKLKYELIHFDAVSNQPKTEKIDIPFDDYEYGAIKSNSSNKYCEWQFLSESDGRALFVKIYFKEIEKSKKKELIFKTMEIDTQGKVYNVKKWNFDPLFANDERKFMTPSVAFDDVNHELMLFGYMSVDKKSLNAVYLIKYDYQSQNTLSSKEYSFSEILKGSDARRTHTSIPKSVGAVIPLEFSINDYYLDKQNKIFALQIITNYSGTETTYYEVKFDKYGDHVQTDLVQYGTYNFKYPKGFKSVAKFHELLMKDNSRAHLAGIRPLANDYLNNNPNKSKDEIFALPIDRPEYSIVVFYNESLGEFSAMKLNTK